VLHVLVSVRCIERSGEERRAELTLNGRARPSIVGKSPLKSHHVLLRFGSFSVASAFGGDADAIASTTFLSTRCLFM